MSTQIPDSHRDLVDGTHCAALTTVLPDGMPHTTVVWCDYDGRFVRVNTMRGFRKEKNMRANPAVTLFIFPLDDPLRTLEIRGTVIEMTEDGAMEHLDALSESYGAGRPYFGACVPAELAATEIPVLCKILPTHVVACDFHKQPEEHPENGGTV